MGTAEAIFQGGSHGRSILLPAALLLLLPSCGGGIDREAPAPLRVGWQKDPIEVPGRGSIPRQAFRRFVSWKLAGPWLRFLALDKALRREIGEEDSGRGLVGTLRAWIGRGLLREWLPESHGVWESRKAAHDLAWTLARVWRLHRGKGGDPLSRKRIEALFLSEVRARKPRLHLPEAPFLATCQGQAVGPEEVYPDLLALLAPGERDRLLLQALERR